jgi:hypothetical protein
LDEVAKSGVARSCRDKPFRPAAAVAAGPQVEWRPAVNHSLTVPQYVPGMDETHTLAARALRELLDNPDRDDSDELLAANRALIEAIATGRPMTRKNARIVAEYLREAGWNEGAIGAATAQAGVHASTDGEGPRCSKASTQLKPGRSQNLVTIHHDRVPGS